MSSGAKARDYFQLSAARLKVVPSHKAFANFGRDEFFRSL